MTASERLREMSGEFEGLKVGDTPPWVIELLFWDELVAVVEAAESLRLDARGGLCDDPFHSKGDKLDSALGRLTAKLGEA